MPRPGAHRVERELDELNEEECRELLGTGRIGRIAFPQRALPAIRPVRAQPDPRSGHRRRELLTQEPVRGSATGAAVVQPAADGDGGAVPPCGAVAVMIRMISARSAGEGSPQSGS